MLDNLIIDNDQCSRQGHIYAEVLGGLLDARGNIVNNNMNVLIKNLTVVNIVFLPLGVIASMGGMSEFSVMLDDLGIPWGLGYPLFAVVLTVLGILLWRGLGSWIDRRMSVGDQSPWSPAAPPAPPASTEARPQVVDRVGPPWPPSLVGRGGLREAQAGEPVADADVRGQEHVRVAQPADADVGGGPRADAP